MAFGPDINSQILSKYGFTGSAGGGAGDNYLKTLYGQGKYDILNQYKTDRQAYQPEYNFDNLGFTMYGGSQPAAQPAAPAAPTPVAPAATGWTPQNNLAAIKKIGYTGNTIGNGEASVYLRSLQDQGNYNALNSYITERKAAQSNYNPAWDGITMPTDYTAGDPKYNGYAGVMPATVEPFNTVQGGALDNLAKGPGESDFYKQLAPLFQQYMTQMNSAANTPAYNPQTANLDAWNNPYNQQVISAWDAQANQGMEKTMNQIAARNARMGNSGSSVEGNMIGGAATDILNNRNSMVASLLKDGYSQALQGSQDSFYKDLANKYQGAAGTLTGISTAQGLDAYGTNKYYNQNQVALNAGNQVQQQNQNQLNAINGVQDASQNYQKQMLEFLKGILGSYPTGSTNTTSTPGNMAGGALGGGLLASQLYPAYQNWSTNNAITSSIANNPSIF